jgi:hypothetical protein
MTPDLRARLDGLERRVRAAVEQRRATDPRPDDPFRGLYVTDAQALELLEPAGRLARSVAPGQPDGTPSAASDGSLIGGLEEAFDLDPWSTELLIVALAPDVDARFERLYGYLQDDVTRRRAGIGLALELAGLPVDDPAARARLSTGGPLVAGGLVGIEDDERSFLTRALRVPDRVTAHLLGDSGLDADVAAVLNAGGVLDARAAGDVRSAAPALARGIAAGTRLSYLREGPGSSAATTAASSVGLAGLASLSIDLARVVTAPQPRRVIDKALLEARLTWRVLIAGPVDAVAERSPELIGGLADAGWPLVLWGARAWEPAWSRAVPLQVEAPSVTAPHRARLWRAALDVREDVPGNGHVAALVEATQAFYLTPPQIERAVESGVLVAQAEARGLEPRDLQTGARWQNAAGLERLARRIAPAASWEDLVVPQGVRAQLLELAARARHRDLVLDEWRIGGRSSRGRGITGLFAGESGTGKTLSAEVIARELGLDLYVIDLSTVVDKYIGETEKNLDRIFSEADRVNGVLLFDEADAIFGKRSEVRDARDRYANVEVAYLLQRMERFDGLAVLTTNLRANLDDSFTRRLDVIIDFPTPDEDARLALWRMHLPDRLPQDPDLDLEFMAHRFALAGGNIRNICLTAAYLAADAATPVRMEDLIRATGREYQKLGRLTIEAEFGAYHRLVVP